MECKTIHLEDQKARELYYKLHRCLKKSLSGAQSLNGDDLSCHANNIIRYLAKSIESGETWYDASVDIWCDYFLEGKTKQTAFTAITESPEALAAFLAELPLIEGPWDTKMQKKRCAECQKEDGACELCPYFEEETRIKEYLEAEVEREEK